MLAACAQNEDDKTSDAKLFSYWYELDEFTEVKASYLDSALWIDEQSGRYLNLQFQCFRGKNEALPNEYNLIINSKLDETESSGIPEFLSAVLYKRDDQAVQIYRRSWDGTPLTGFQNASLNVYPMFAEDEQGKLPQTVKFRFIYGLAPVDVRFGEIDDISRAASVDLTIDTTDPDTEQFLYDCASKAEKGTQPHDAQERL